MQDLPAVVPLLVYRDIVRAHEFLVRAFGFEADDRGRGELTDAGRAALLPALEQISRWAKSASPAGALPMTFASLQRLNR
jgi:hypothetical protein